MINNRWEKHKNIYVFVDGASSGNPGRAGIGIVVRQQLPDGSIYVEKISRFIGTKTNNEAEYTAVLEALKALEKKGITKAIVCSDSYLVVNQLNGKYKLKSKNLLPIFNEIKEKIKGKDIVFKWIEREKNKEADKLAKNSIKSC